MYAHIKRLFLSFRGTGGNGPSGRCHGRGHRCFNSKWSPRLQLAEECKKNAALDPIKASAHEYVISAVSLTCNGNTEYACSETCNSEFRVDLFRSKGEFNQKTGSDFGISIFFFFLKNVTIHRSECNADSAVILKKNEPIPGENQKWNWFWYPVPCGTEAFVFYQRKSHNFIKHSLPSSSLPIGAVFLIAFGREKLWGSREYVLFCYCH